MKIKLKTLKGLVIDLDTPPDTVVQKVKEMGAASEHGKAEGWDPEGMKLIYQGKMLENTKDLASYSIKEVPAAPPRSQSRRWHSGPRAGRLPPWA